MDRADSNDVSGLPSDTREQGPVEDAATGSIPLRHRPKRRLILGASGTIALNVATILLNFVVTLVLSRALGVDGFGAFAFALTWAMILAVPASLGLLPLVIRSVSADHINGRFDAIRSTLRRANLAVMSSSLVVVTVAAVSGWILWGSEPELLRPYWIALLLVPLTALTMVRQGAMQGLGRVVLGRTPEALIAPLCFLVLVLVSWFASRDTLTAPRATALNVVSFATAFVLGALLLARLMPRGTHRTSEAHTSLWEWLRPAGPLLVLNGATVVHGGIGTILLGTMEGSGEAGIFNIALRAALVVGLISTGASYALLPIVARLSSQGHDHELQDLITMSARWVLGLTLPLALVVVVFARPLLLLFGADFDSGVTTIRLIVAGDIVRIAFGFGALTLLMAGHDRVVAGTAVAGVATTLVLDVALIPLWGSAGAAVGLGLGVILSAAMAAWALARRLQLYAPVVGATRYRAMIVGRQVRA